MDKKKVITLLNKIKTGDELMNKNININELSVIDLVNIILNNTLEIETVFELILEYASNLLNVGQSSIMIVDENKEYLVIRTVFNKDKKIIGKKIKVNESIAGWVYTKRTPILVNDIEKDSYFKKKNNPQYEKKHLLSYPLILNGEIIGIMNFNDKKGEDTFTQADIDIISSLAKQILFALDQAVQEERTAKVMSDMFNEIVALYETGEKFLHSENIENLYEHSLRMIKNILNVEETSIWFYSTSKKELVLVAELGFKYKNISIIPDGKYVIGTVAQTGRSAIINNIEEHPYFNKDNTLVFEQNNFLCVPIGKLENTLGVLTAGNKQKSRIYYQTVSNAITDGDRRMLYAIADQLYIAINYLKIKNNLENIVQERTLQLQNALNEMEKISKRKDEFLSYVSHELRAPLSVIKASNELISDIETNLAPDSKNLLEITINESNRLNKMINDILDFARFEDGKMEFDFQLNDINGLLIKIAEQFRSKAEKKNVSMQIDIDKNIPKIKFDYDKIFVVITNLIDNAVKYNRINGKVNIETSMDDNDVIITIKDTGYGIDEESVPHVFEKYFRVSSKSTEEKGSGLGLTICKHIIDKHNGTIAVKSELDKGTEFTIRFPIHS